MSIPYQSIDSRRNSKVLITLCNTVQAFIAINRAAQTAGEGMHVSIPYQSIDSRNTQSSHHFVQYSIGLYFYQHGCQTSRGGEACVHSLSVY